MANEEQLAILRQGVEVWNNWRDENPRIKIDLFQADLREENLVRANFNNANLKQAYLMVANLWNAQFRGANLLKANLREADLIHADLRKANLAQTDLGSTNLDGADLTNANLSEANLLNTNIGRAKLYQSKWKSATIGNTIFVFNDLSRVIGLDEVNHQAPSSIGIETIQQSNGKIPDVFLRGCGCSDWQIEASKFYDPDLSNAAISDKLYRIYDLRAQQPIQISPLFISYTHGDSEFVDKLENQLNIKGVRFWRDIHEMKAGRIETQIDRAITQNRTVLLVLSEHSQKSDWVEHEVRKARGLEKDMGRDVLCPIALDDSWKDSKWDKHLMEQVLKYNILDFSAWEDDVKFEEMFRKLIDGLQLFYKG